MWKYVKKMKEEQFQKAREEQLQKIDEFLERLYEMSEEELLKTELPDYANITKPDFIILEMARRGMIEGPVL